MEAVIFAYVVVSILGLATLWLSESPAKEILTCVALVAALGLTVLVLSWAVNPPAVADGDCLIWNGETLKPGACHNG